MQLNLFSETFPGCCNFLLPPRLTGPPVISRDVYYQILILVTTSHTGHKHICNARYFHWLMLPFHFSVSSNDRRPSHRESCGRRGSPCQVEIDAHWSPWRCRRTTSSRRKHLTECQTFRDCCTSDWFCPWWELRALAKILLQNQMTTS